MAVDKQSVTKFLEAPLPVAPDFKTETRSVLQGRIKSITGIKFRRVTDPPLYSHQFRGVAAALWYGKCCLFLGMRLGKTRIALEWASHLWEAGLWHGKGLVIVPSPLLLDVWAEQIEQYSDLPFKVVRGTDPAKLEKAAASKTKLIVISITSLQHMYTVKQKVKQRTQKGVRFVNKMVADLVALETLGKQFALSIVDEIHTYKNKGSLRFQMADALMGKHSYRLGLTGTPYGRNPFDAWAQGMLIDGGKTLGNNYYFFEYCFGERKSNPFSSRGWELKFDKKKLPILAKKLNSFSISYKLEEVRELDVIPVDTKLIMSGQQKAEYNKALEVYRDKENLSAKAVNNIFVQLRQISCGLVPFLDTQGQRRIMQLPDHVKLRWLKDQLEAGLFEAPCVLFHDYTAVGQNLCDFFKANKIKHGWLYGGTKDKTGVVRNFQKGKTQVLVANTASGSVGVDFSRADYLGFYQAPTSPTVRIQAEKRPMGPARGTRPLVLEDIVCSPVEERVLGFTVEGKEMLDLGIHSGAKLLRAWGA